MLRRIPGSESVSKNTIPFRKSIVKLRIHSTILCGGIVILAVLALSVILPSSSAAAQQGGLRVENARYHNPHGQGRYGGYGYYSQRNFGHDAYGRSIYGYPGYRTTTYVFGSPYRYGGTRFIQSYGGSTYYQPHYGGSNYYQPYGGRIYFGLGF